MKRITLLQRYSLLAFGSTLGLILVADPSSAFAVCAAQGAACATNAACCAPDLVCVDSTCQYQTNAGCSASNTCAGDSCVNGECQPDPNQDSRCASDLDCGQVGVYTMACYNQACLMTSGAHSCDGNPAYCFSDNCNLGIPNTCSCSAHQSLCATTSDCCLTTDECVQGTCLAGHAQSCAGVGDCASNHCAGGFCQCSNSGQGCGSNGDCTACNANSECVNGTCAIKNGSACGLGDVCVQDLQYGGFMPGSTCVTSTCTRSDEFNECLAGADCDVGQVCTAGMENFGWREGYCLIPTGSALACGQNGSCISNTCTSGTCAASALYGTCTSNFDCATGLGCDLDRNVCREKKAASCASNYQCLSDSCVTSACACSSSGGDCSVTADCCGALTCVAGHC